MQTLMEVLQKTRAFFESKGIDNARLEAELLFAHVLKCPRLDLYLQFERPLDDSTLEQLRGLVKRRSNREPLQYVLGEAPFREFMVKVDSRVLIPRPETELLVDHIIAQVEGSPKRILDLGTGSGVLALALAREYPQSEVVAVDKSQDALVLARENAELCGVAERVLFIESDWLSSVSGTYDLIVSNPPYLTLDEWENAQAEVKVFEPRSALTAEKEGLADLESILNEAPACLEKNGVVALETGIAQHESLEAISKKVGYTRALSLQDDTERDRFFFAWI